jgi:hypothetical protein
MGLTPSTDVEPALDASRRRARLLRGTRLAKVAVNLVMPRFFFDLFLGKYVVLDPGGMMLSDRFRAMSAAGELADHLFRSRTDLHGSGSWIRVRDHRGKTIGRLDVEREPVAESAE